MSKRTWTVSPESYGFLGYFTFHFCHTSAVPLVFNLAVLSSLGKYIYKVKGHRSFVSLLAMGCAGASLAVATDISHNRNQVQAGGLGASAAMLAYGGFATPQYFALFRYMPLTYMGAALAYGVYFDDKAVVGGLAAGYAAFMLAL